jgi:hypothetical protein
MPQPLAHISSIRHLIDLKLERNPNFREADPNDAAAAPESRFHCPVRLWLPSVPWAGREAL